jgi:hypothetical protein
MNSTNAHWTERGTADFQFRIGFDFIQQINDLLDARVITRKQFAANLHVSKGRVSQVLNDPGNLTLKQVVKYARGVRRKVSVVLYDDGDNDNRKGPISPQVFSRCWERQGKPSDVFKMEQASQAKEETSALFAVGAAAGSSGSSSFANPAGLQLVSSKRPKRVRLSRVPRKQDNMKSGFDNTGARGYGK